MNNVNTAAAAAALMINNSGEFSNSNRYLELVDKNETLDSHLSSERSDSSSTISSRRSIRSQSLSKMSPVQVVKRGGLDDRASSPSSDSHAHVVKKVNEILDTCLLTTDNKQLCANSNSLVVPISAANHQESSFTCKICLNKFPLSSSAKATSTCGHLSKETPHLFSSSSLDAPYLVSSSSLTSLESNCLSSIVEAANRPVAHLNEPAIDEGNRLFQIESCKCKFCTSCLNMYVEQSIKNFNVSPLHCPDSKCDAKGFLSPVEVKYLLDGPFSKDSFVGDINDNLVLSSTVRDHKPSELFEKYLKICENIEILRNPYKIHCPQPDCQNVCTISTSNETSRSLRNAKVSCDKCRHEFCSTCFKKWNNEERNNRSIKINDHQPFDDVMISSIVADDAPLNTSILLEKSCSPVIEKKKFSRSRSRFDDEICLCTSHENGGENDDEVLSRQKCLFDNLENIKRCPKCSVLIEKADGCAQIMCKMCKHTFCFYCLTSLDNDFLLKHYTKNGPCKGKLGHSRLSLLFHRFSVVAIFGGTILLIILLSPFLLLSLPCLVFSRKFRKSCFKLSSKFG